MYEHYLITIGKLERNGLNCRKISEEELLKERIGGYKGILYTLFHIVDVEQRWVNGISFEEPKVLSFEDYKNLDSIIKFSSDTKTKTLNYLENLNPSSYHNVLSATNKKGDKVSHYYIEVLLHIAVHEVHHIGQLSVWARELGKEPITANLIGLDLFKV